MTRDEILNAIHHKAETDQAVQALLLAGSLGKKGGSGDEWSDIDLIFVLEPEAQPAFLEQAENWLREIVPLCFWMNTIPGLPIFSAITDKWERIDLTLTVPGLVMGTQDSVTALFDKTGIVAGLAPSAAPRAPDPAKITALVNEFIRVLGLTPIVLGREDYIAGVSGLGLQRTALLDLILESMALAAPPGALSLSSTMGADDRAMLEALPPIEANQHAIIAAHHAIAMAFVPRAKALMADMGMAWPDMFWDATQAHLQQALGTAWQSID